MTRAMNLRGTRRSKAKQITDALHTLEQKWNSLRFGEGSFETIEKQHKFEVSVYFNDINPDTIQIELFANGSKGESPIVQNMTRGAKLEGTGNGYHYYASVTATSPALDYTARAIPYLPNVSVPLEISRILWQR